MCSRVLRKIYKPVNMHAVNATPTRNVTLGQVLDMTDDFSQWRQLHVTVASTVCSNTQR